MASAMVLQSSSTAAAPEGEEEVGFFFVIKKMCVNIKKRRPSIPRPFVCAATKIQKPPQAPKRKLICKVTKKMEKYLPL
jgi:hypothetical protein